VGKMTEEKEKEKAQKKIVETEQSIENIKDKLIGLTAEFRKNQDELNQQIYNQGKDEFADINLEELLTTGEAFHKHNINSCSFVLKTLVKKESLEIDKRTKEYINESTDFYNSSVQTDVLAYVLKEYNGKEAPKGEKAFERSREAVISIGDEVINVIYTVYSRMSRWVRAALDINLKN
jgi:hypothetical protein